MTYQRTIEFDQAPVEVVREMAQTTIDEEREYVQEDSHDRYETIADTVDLLIDKHLSSGNFAKQMVFLDEVTEAYDLTNRDYESEQATKSAGEMADWRNNVISSYGWHIIYEALAYEISERL